MTESISDKLRRLADEVDAQPTEPVTMLPAPPTAYVVRDGAGNTIPTPFVSPGARMVALERARQVAEEGYDPAHDRAHQGDELAWAAYCYLKQATDPVDTVPAMWPWKDREWKPKDDRIRNLTIAAALIVAEIDRSLPERNPS